MEQTEISSLQRKALTTLLENKTLFEGLQICKSLPFQACFNTFDNTLNFNKNFGVLTVDSESFENFACRQDLLTSEDRFLALESLANGFVRKYQMVTINNEYSLIPFYTDPPENYEIISNKAIYLSEPVAKDDVMIITAIFHSNRTHGEYSLNFYIPPVDFDIPNLAKICTKSVIENMYRPPENETWSISMEPIDDIGYLDDPDLANGYRVDFDNATDFEEELDQSFYDILSDVIESKKAYIFYGYDVEDEHPRGMHAEYPVNVTFHPVTVNEPSTEFGNFLSLEDLQHERSWYNHFERIRRDIDSLEEWNNFDIALSKGFCNRLILDSDNKIITSPGNIIWKNNEKFIIDGLLPKKGVIAVRISFSYLTRSTNLLFMKTFDIKNIASFVISYIAEPNGLTKDQFYNNIITMLEQKQSGEFTIDKTRYFTMELSDQYIYV